MSRELKDASTGADAVMGQQREVRAEGALGPRKPWYLKEVGYQERTDWHSQARVSGSHCIQTLLETSSGVGPSSRGPAECGSPDWRSSATASTVDCLDIGHIHTADNGPLLEDTPSCLLSRWR